VCSTGACSVTCGSGLAKCNNSCVDLLTDKTNCGFCAQNCAGNLICSNGDCACPAGTTDCGGVCADLATSAANCGSCGTSCAAGQQCVSSVCN